MAAIHNTDGFQTFWRAYPRRVSKADALKAWNRLKPDAALVQAMLSALEWQVRTPGWRAGFVPYPATWLRHERWLDEPFDPPADAQRFGKQTTRLAQAVANIKRDAT